MVRDGAMRVWQLHPAKLSPLIRFLNLYPKPTTPLTHKSVIAAHQLVLNHVCAASVFDNKSIVSPSIHWAFSISQMKLQICLNKSSRYKKLSVYKCDILQDCESSIIEIDL